MSTPNSSTTPPRIVDIDDEVEICREESCTVLGIHAKHVIPPPLRGRRPRWCPSCRNLLTQTTVDEQVVLTCERCGFHRP